MEWRLQHHFNYQENLLKVDISGVSCDRPTLPPGLEQCVWAGRNQTITRGRITYYLDGAHTPQSVKVMIGSYLITRKTNGIIPIGWSGVVQEDCR